MSAPDFFIVGAPKCGTTTLYEALRAHPRVFMPDVKEPHFFSPDLHSPNYIDDLQTYLALFAAARKDQVVGEASVYYLYSNQAARLIHQHNPSAKIIIMLRNPLDMVHSLHSQAVYNCDEDLTNLSDALAAEEERRRGRRIPPASRLPHMLHYRAIADYEPQVRRYFDIFGEERVHVVLFDDLVTATEATFTGCLDFLGVDTQVPMQTTWANPNTTLRWPALERVVKQRPHVRGLFKRVAPGLYSALYRWFHRVNMKTQTRAAMDPALRARLRCELAPGTEALGLLIDRDLSSWTCEDSMHGQTG